MQKNLNSNKIIEFEDVTKTSTNGNKDDVLGISFSINEGEFVSFVGPSGCGKTTTMLLLAGIIEKNDYQRVLITFIKESSRKNILASTVAAPLFERITQTMLIHDRIL